MESGQRCLVLFLNSPGVHPAYFLNVLLKCGMSLYPQDVAISAIGVDWSAVSIEHIFSILKRVRKSEKLILAVRLKNEQKALSLMDATDAMSESFMAS